MNRAGVVDALRAGGYTGPVSYSMPRLRGIAAEILGEDSPAASGERDAGGGSKASSSPRPSRTPSKTAQERAEARAARGLATVGLLPRAGDPSWKPVLPGTPCRGRLHSYAMTTDAEEAATQLPQRCCGTEQCYESWIARGLMDAPAGWLPMWKRTEDKA